MTGREYAGGRMAERRERIRARARENWRAAAAGLGFAGVGSSAIAAWSLFSGSMAILQLGLAMAVLSALLFGGAAWATIRADRVRGDEPVAETVDLAHLIAREAARNPAFRAGVEAAGRNYPKRRP